MIGNMCGMGCDAPAERGGFYCHGCLGKWARERELTRRKKVEAQQSKEIQALRNEIAELKLTIGAIR